MECPERIINACVETIESYNKALPMNRKEFLERWKNYGDWTACKICISTADPKQIRTPGYNCYICPIKRYCNDETYDNMFDMIDNKRKQNSIIIARREALIRIMLFNNIDVLKLIKNKSIT